MHHFNWGGEEIWLLPEMAIHLPEHKTLVVSDLHLSKTGHFRKSGVPVPQQVYVEDLQRLLSLIQSNKIEKLIVVGDFFHSHANKELEFFSRWRNDFSQLKIALVKGNHDILSNDWYNENKIDLYDEELLTINKISFIHDYSLLQKNLTQEDNFFISGHIHPSIYINGKSRQGFRLPCFYFSGKHAVLPAFSKFSGHATVKPKKGDYVFGIANNKILPL